MVRTRVHDGFVKVDEVVTPLGKREVVIATDSVAFLVYNRTDDEVLLVTQDRAPMIRDDNPTGTIMEVGAGRFDKVIGVVGLVKAELHEELGVTNVPDDAIVILNDGIPLALSPGVLTERQYLAFVEVMRDQIDSTKRLYGAADEREQIERRFIPVSQLVGKVFDDMKTWALVQWFLKNKGR